MGIEDNLESKDVNTEEDIEIFVQNILQVIPKFKVIDSKIKNAYYIKVGNMTTSTKILEGEVIESTLFYQKWKSAIDYFENMAKEIKSGLVIIIHPKIKDQIKEEVRKIIHLIIGGNFPKGRIFGWLLKGR